MQQLISDVFSSLFIGAIFIGGVHDLRPLLEQALRSSPILPADLLDVRYTLVRARTLQRTLGRLADQRAAALAPRPTREEHTRHHAPGQCRDDTPP
jgi:dsDNA-specific endonuclease/ATPase MutS2